MVIQPLIGNPYNGYINPYYWVDDHPLLYGNNGSLDPSTNGRFSIAMLDYRSATLSESLKLTSFENIFWKTKKKTLLLARLTGKCYDISRESIYIFYILHGSLT